MIKKMDLLDLIWGCYIPMIKLLKKKYLNADPWKPIKKKNKKRNFILIKKWVVKFWWLSIKIDIHGLEYFSLKIIN